jgi:hypothetical protein
LYLIAEEAWEIANPLVKALPSAEGRFFSCVEVELNAPLWHLDILVTATNGIECWRRFVLTSPEQAAATAAEHHDISRLHFQFPRSPGGNDYEIWQVYGLSIGHDLNRRVVYVIELPHMELIYPDRGVKTSELYGLRRLYQFPEKADTDWRA